MATLEQLVERNALVCVDVPLDGGKQPWRTLLSTARLINWLSTDLPSLDGNRGDLSPVQQLDTLFADFIAGEPLGLARHLKLIHPRNNGVWELRTADIRVFGWFPRRNVFIGSSAGLKHQIERYDLYDEHRDLAVSDRIGLGLQDPDCIYGERYHDILSDADIR